MAAASFISNDKVISDMYMYEIPITIRRSLCTILTEKNVWKPLAIHMGYVLKDIDEMQCAARQSRESEIEELLSCWGEQNHTITELFVLLRRIHQYEAMNVIKNLVDQRYHKLIIKTYLKETANPITPDISKSKWKDLCLEEKIQNGPPVDELRKTNENKKTHSESLAECVSQLLKIDYAELLNSTENWSDRHVLGRGGFGTVFYGIWKFTAVAIKRIQNTEKDESRQNKLRTQQSLNELRHLNACRHDNILPLYGYSINGDELCLVNQLMHGGSLEHRLFELSPNTPPLTWNERVNIAVGTARGLQFLHTFTVKPLIHGDIKPANILLDTFNQPKIGDFGLAREGIFGHGMEVSRIFGTRPYLPIEFLRYRLVSVKVDSYSFGVMLFEMATGLCAFKKKFKYSVDYLRTHIHDGTSFELIDKAPKVKQNTAQIFTTIIDLGIKCTHDKPEIRYDMVKALQILEMLLVYIQKFDAEIK